MPVTDRSTQLAPLLADLAADPGLADELVAAARAASPDVARLPVGESRRHVTLLLAAGLAAFVDPAVLDDAGFGPAERLGADRAAQGVPVGGLLAGVRAARGRLLAVAVERGRAAGVPDDVLLAGALDADRYFGVLERHVIDGYHAAERRLARGQRDRRDRFLRRLLGGEPVGPDEPGVFGLRVSQRYRCIVVDIGDPDRSEAVAQRLAVCGGLFGTVAGRLAGLAVRLPDPGRIGADTLAVAAPPLPLARAATGYRLCLAALSAADRFGRRGLQPVLGLAGEAALAAQPELAALLGEELLAGLDPADGFHRELVATALSYLDNGQRLDRTAAALHVHPNTVRYRLRALRERSTLPLDDATVLQTLRSWWALHTWLHPRAATDPGRDAPSR